MTSTLNAKGAGMTSTLNAVMRMTSTLNAVMRMTSTLNAVMRMTSTLNAVMRMAGVHVAPQHLLLLPHDREMN